MLSRFHGGGNAGPCECWTVAKNAAKTVHMTPHNFSTALRGLTEKTFIDSRGREVPVLVRMRGGYSNTPAVYFDNVFADIEGVETLTPKEVTSQTPLTDVENHEGVEPEPQRGWAGTTKGLGVQPPIEIEEKNREEDKESYDSLSSYPSQYMENGSLNGEGAAPRPDDGAARQSDEPTPEGQEAEARPRDPDLEREAEAHAAEIRRVCLKFSKHKRLNSEDMGVHAKYLSTETYKRISEEFRRNEK